MLLLIAASFIIFSGCKKNDNLVSPSAKSSVDNYSALGSSESFKSGKPTETNIEFIYTGQNPDGTLTGTFSAHGGLEASGTTTMAVNQFGNVAHCSQTLVASGGGTITILSNCQFSTNTGTWRIVSGTGAYADLKGNGKLLMTFPSGVFVVESYSGQVK